MGIATACYRILGTVPGWAVFAALGGCANLDYPITMPDPVPKIVASAARTVAFSAPDKLRSFEWSSRPSGPQGADAFANRAKIGPVLVPYAQNMLRRLGYRDRVIPSAGAVADADCVVALDVANVERRMAMWTFQESSFVMIGEWRVIDRSGRQLLIESITGESRFTTGSTLVMNERIGAGINLMLNNFFEASERQLAPSIARCVAAW